MKKLLLLNITLLALTTLFTQAYALTITPGPEVLWGNDTSQPQIDDILADYNYGAGVGTELYKSEVGGGEFGALAGSYETSYFNTETDPEDATITYTGGSFITDNPFLLVKDGNQEPAWYLFDLGGLGLGWDGMETLDLKNFWLDNGAISHVTLYGGSNPVPEPASMVLFGIGLLGIAGLGRRTRKK